MLELENVFIELGDGRKLAARIWLPDDANENPVPAILEYLPYRKRDGTAARDEANYPAFAEAGYAGVRVDISGTGESDGDYDDEYSPRELGDGIEVIHWISEQLWCNGKLGMMGISWGGFNSLQIAALQPEPLKAVIAIGTTVDRYNDDIHYKNGCHLYSNFMWSSTMLCFASRPPDPLLAGEEWKKNWLHRLRTQPFPLETWLTHQRRDGYWRHGSVCENYAAIQIPSLVISGWADGYINAPPAMAANSLSVSRAVNGPWIHKYPHFAYPKPRMDFIGEAVAWWDHWLKGIENGAEEMPAYRAFISERVRPGGYREYESGRWVAETQWPSPNIAPLKFFLTQQSVLSGVAGSDQRLTISSPQDCGIACGEVFTLKPDSEMPGDQRADDIGSLVFDTELLKEPVEILGRPTIALKCSIDKPIGNFAVRLCDVHADGVSHRVSWGVLNLAHRESNEYPCVMIPGEDEIVTITLDECGYRFSQGHKIRISISTAYWPMIMPPPEAICADIELGENSYICLPQRQGNDRHQVNEPESRKPMPDFPMLTEEDYKRQVTRDLHNNKTHFHVYDDTGETEIPKHGMRSRHTHDETWSISPDDPLSSTAVSEYVCYMSRGDWNIRTVSNSSLRCDRENYYLDATVEAFHGDELVNSRSWKKTIKRYYQ